MESATADKVPHYQQDYCPGYKNTNNIKPIRVFFNHDCIIDLQISLQSTKWLLSGVLSQHESERKSKSSRVNYYVFINSYQIFCC